MSTNSNVRQFKKWGGAVLIPLDELIPTYWNCNEMGESDFAVLLDEVDKGGFDEPLQVVQIPSGPNKDKYLILGGEHRYKTARCSGIKEVPCVIKKHLNASDESELMVWSVQRNNIRGKLNEQKYLAIQDKVTNRLGISREVAQRRMNIRESMLKDINKLKHDERKEEAEAAKKQTEAPKSKAETDGQREELTKLAERKKLLQSLKAAEKDVLLQSGDTVEHGYLFFTQSGKKHLVVEETKRLYALVKEMVGVCKNNSADINQFLAVAISKELKHWKDE